MVTLTGTLDTLNMPWVYVVTNSDTQETLYVGCERIRTIPTLRELKRHALNQLTSTTPLSIELIAPVKDEVEALELIETLVVIHSPRYIKGQSSTGRRVRCDTTGEVYANALRASQATGVNYSYLHYHLQGCEGYKQCKGLTFSYIEA
jgi:hypothetical protein